MCADKMSETFLNNLLEYEYVPNFISITRPNDNNGGTCIDNIFSKSKFKITSHKILQKITDHNPLLLHIELNLSEHTENTREICKIDYKKLDYLASKENFSLLVNNDNDINNCLVKLIDKIKYLVLIVTTKSKIKINCNKKNRKHKEWITPALKKS